ncbi:MAG TPA: histidine kinase [Longimicrobium sp.]|nr:histidine kinase [Longimicrobium sp.]
MSQGPSPSVRNAPRRAAGRLSGAALRELLRSRRAWGVFAVVWLFQTAGFIGLQLYQAEPEQLARGLRHGAVDTLSWLVVQLAAFAVAWTVPVEPRRPVRTTAALMAAGAVVLTARLAVLRATGGFPGEALGMLMLRLVPFHLVLWLSDVGAGYAIAHYFRRRDREVAAGRLEARLAQAQMQVLKMQIHPHFLFNTLNSVSALMHRDPEEAVRTIGRLKQLLERTQARAAVQEVRLSEELEFLSLYLEIESTRLGERLSIRTDVEPGVEGARVPHLALQLLVENAIRHGIAPRRGPGSVEVRAERRGGRLLLQVLDDGRGLPPEGTARRGGVGVANTRARLAQLYGADHRFEVRTRPEGGTAATIDIPFAAAGAG